MAVRRIPKAPDAEADRFIDPLGRVLSSRSPSPRHGVSKPQREPVSAERSRNPSQLEVA